jgi:hypothetical protein
MAVVFIDPQNEVLSERVFRVALRADHDCLARRSARRATPWRP